MDRRHALRLLAAAAGAMQLPVRSQAVKTDGVRSMLTRKIPSSGELLPAIGLGTWQSFDVGTDAAARAPLENVLREFAALGGKLIDSSPMYGRSEEVAGDLIAKLGLREKLFIATKVWTSGKAQGIAQMEDSMKKLRANPIELMQVHNLLDVDTHLRTLSEYKREGRVRYVGVTHYTASAFDAVAKVIRAHAVDFLQINYSAGEREAEKLLLPLARERGVAGFCCRDRLHELGPIAAQIRYLASVGHLRDSGDGTRRASARQHGRGRWSHAGRKTARTHCGEHRLK
jgi:hypothetical protein